MDFKSIKFNLKCYTMLPNQFVVINEHLNTKSSPEINDINISRIKASFIASRMGWSTFKLLHDMLCIYRYVPSLKKTIYILYEKRRKVKDLQN